MRVKTRLLIYLLLWVTTSIGWSQEVAWPIRAVTAPSGSEFAQGLIGKEQAKREEAIAEQVRLGNLPEFWRRFVPLTVTKEIDGRAYTLVYQVAPDYLAVGQDTNYFLCPLMPTSAQTLADSLGCMLPTRKMVDDIYAAAPVKLNPTPIPPSNAMTSVPVFLEHNAIVKKQRDELGSNFPLGVLAAGHKKDVVITPRLTNSPGKVAIYGWHQATGKPIQPLYLGHTVAWVDYSHGIRFVKRAMVLDGKPVTAEAILKDEKLCVLLSDEGVIASPKYSVSASPETVTKSAAAVSVANSFNEITEVLNFDLGVRVMINRPAELKRDEPVHLIFYALPNGNTIEQTLGRKLKEGDDWHYDIQHIGAQTRWLREALKGTNIVIAYLECAEKSWPTWRRKNDPDNKRIAPMVEAIQKRFPAPGTKLILTGHSGGGSFTFGYLNGVARIPEAVERIAFLDSNYAYDGKAGHADKILRWLKSSEDHYLCVLAYHDSIALLNGKTFVSESGGTWGRSLAMLQDFGQQLKWQSETDAEWQRHVALDGRVKFFLKENPAKAVLHTRQVEWNGFIHAMLSGTRLEGEGYTYMGARAYGRWVASEEPTASAK